MYGENDIPFDGPLRDALRDRAARDSIRSLHLSSRNTSLLHSIISSLIPDGEGIKYSSVESLILEDFNLDASDFLTHHRFPKLRYLALLVKSDISTWDHLKSHTTALTTLSLINRGPSISLTTSQVLSILASNPQLRHLSLSIPTTPHDGDDVSTFRVPLDHLKELNLDGDFHPVFRLLRRLAHPESMDYMTLFLFDCKSEDVSGILGPYLRDRIQRNGRCKGGLGFVASLCPCLISTKVAMISGANGPTLSSVPRPPFLVSRSILNEDLTPEALDKLYIDFVARIPKEHVVCFETDMRLGILKKIIATMPNIQELRLINVKLSGGFLQPDPDGPFANTKLLQSLRYLHLASINDDDLRPLVSYLAYQTSGGQVVSLKIAGNPIHICPPVVETIKSLVQELVLELILVEKCPLGVCQEVPKRKDDSEE